MEVFYEMYSMKKKQIIGKMLLLAFAFFFLFAGMKMETQAASTKIVKVSVNKAKQTLKVSYKNKELYTIAYKKEKVYAYVDILYGYKGPGSKYKKSSSIRMDMGEKATRIGVTPSGKYSILTQNGKFYFVKTKYLSSTKPESKLSKKLYTAYRFKRKGVLHWNGWRWTWYSQRVLPGRGLHIPGRHVDSMGYVCDEDGYICLASGRLRKGTIVKTPLGKKGKVYDSGCARNTLDVYTNF